MTRKRYRILSGIHYEKNPDGTFTAHYPRDPKEPDELDTSVFESDGNLEKLNVPGAPPRFELLDSPLDELDAMTVKQLKELARTEEVELGRAERKADIMAVIRGVRAVRGEPAGVN